MSWNAAEAAGSYQKALSGTIQTLEVITLKNELSIEKKGLWAKWTYLSVALALSVIFY